MSVALVFPPVVDPRAPHLGLPSLAAWLRAQGEQVHLFDLNVLGLRYLLQPRSLEESARTLRTRLGSDIDLASPEGRLAHYAPHLIGGIEAALATFGDRHRFFDAHALDSARELVTAGLALSAAARPGIAYGIAPPRYDVDGIDPQRLADLIGASADPRCNLFAEHWEHALYPRLAALAPEVVGVSITNRQQIVPGLTLARALRERGHFTVIGGTVFTKFAAELRSLPAFFEHFADAVIAYEGETAMSALLQELRGARRFAEVPNLLYVERGEVRASATHVEDVNALPTPDFDGLDLGAYLAPYPVLPILTGKGCYFNRCKFCDIPFINHISRKAYRVRRVERIAADVETLAERFGCRHFVITDEALSPRLLVKLGEALAASRARRFAFTGYARLEAGFTPEVCSALREMGMKKLFFGLESADQATLDHMDKGTRAEVAPAVLRNCAEAGVHFHVFSIIGFPQESEASARNTLDFFLANREAIDAPGNSLDIHPFGLELRTDYFRERERFGVAVEPAALGKEFVIGIDRADWRNAAGLGAEDVQRLLGEEFYPRLRDTYRRFHATADGIWPGFEEYAVLYSAYYEGRGFGFYTSVPAALETGERLWLDWNPAVAVMQRDERVLLLQRRRFLLLARDTYEALRARSVADLGDLLASSFAEAGSPSATREYLDWLVSRGFLHLRVLSAASDAARLSA